MHRTVTSFPPFLLIHSIILLIIIHSQALSDHAKRNFKALNQYNNAPFGNEVAELVQTLFNLIDDNIRIEEYTFFPSLKAGKTHIII
jgi:hypothetical protein